MISQESTKSVRLHQELRAQEDAGLRNLPWKPTAESALGQRVVDFDWLVAQPLLPFLVNQISPQVLFQSLREHGLEDSVEIVEWIRGPQLQKVFDYDLFTASAENNAEDVDSRKFLDWVRAWFEISPQFAADRFLELEEETMILIMSKMLIILPEGLGAKMDEGDENIWTTKDNKFHLKMRDTDSDQFELAHAFVESLYFKSVKLAESVLAHTSMLVRDETLEDAIRWRSGRLADAGFVAKEDAKEMLRPLKISHLAARIQEAIQMETYRSPVGSMESEDLDEEKEIQLQTLSAIPQATALHIIENALGEENVLLLSGNRSEMEVGIFEDAELMEEAVDAIAKQCQRLLSVVDVESLRHSRDQAGVLEIEATLSLLATEDPVAASSYKARIARISNAVAAATVPAGVNGFETDIMARALMVVRGALNVGLQKCETLKDLFGLDEFESLGDEDDRLQILTKVGPEFLFKLGWTEITSLGKIAAAQLKALSEKSPEKFSFLNKIVRVEFSDGTSAEYDVSAMLERDRFVEVRQWLSQHEFELSSAIYFVLNSILNRVPLYPQILMQDASRDAKTVGQRPFERLSEIAEVVRFIENLEHNLEANF